MKKFKTIDCPTCNGSGFSKPGTGYDAVCDTCGGQGEIPESWFPEHTDDTNTDNRTEASS